MKQLLFFLFLLLTLGSKTWAQTDRNNFPKPPIAELKKFNPYHGMYSVTSDYAGRKFKGTLEWKPAIKNWYLQSTIQLQDESKKIDRELRIMMTWDARLQKYRLWRFQTTPHAPPDQLEGEAKFVGDELVQEWKFKDEKGAFTFRNRLKMISPNKLQIISEEEEEGEPKKVTQVGVTTCTRIVTKNKYTL
jgi:hypothetical protein